jgi:hypothetical protein
VNMRTSHEVMPDGTEFLTWEQPIGFTRTLHVNNGHPRASDANPDRSECAVLANELPAAQVVEFVREGNAEAVILPPESVNTVVFPHRPKGTRPEGARQ